MVLVLPVGLGQSSRAFATMAQTAMGYKRFLGVVSRLLIFSMILKAVVDVSDRLGEQSAPLNMKGIAVAVFLCVGVHLTALSIGFWSSRLVHSDRAGQIAVAFSCSQKTLPVSLYLFDVYFKETYPLAVVPLLAYHVGQLLVDTVIADLLVKHQKTENAS